MLPFIVYIGCQLTTHTASSTKVELGSRASLTSKGNIRRDAFGYNEKEHKQGEKSDSYHHRPHLYVKRLASDVFGVGSLFD
jgi:hypothetical protein